MQLVINTKGSYIKKRGECFEIKSEDKKTEISARKVQSILITTAVLVSTDAILLAHENNIDIIFLDHFGNPFSRVWHSKFGSTAFIRRRQLELSINSQGVTVATDWICTKLENQIEHLEKLAATREKKRENIENIILKIVSSKNKIENIDAENIDDVRGTILGYEGVAGKYYFEALNFIIPEKYKFEGRSRTPAEDPFNAFLNYGYGVLYSRVERGLIVSGLDPYIGFLHTDNYGKKSFVFDVIELFRMYVDEVVIKLFSKRMVKQEMYREIKNGITLDKPGKELLITEFNKSMDETIRYGGRNIKKKNIIDFECHKIANSFIEREESDADMVDL